MSKICLTGLKGGRIMTSALHTHPGGGPPRRRRALATLLAAALLPLAAAPARAALTPDRRVPVSSDFDQQVLFKAADEEGYACFRIPAIVRTTGGILLAFAEGRVHDCGDAGDIDLVLKRSTDGGRTWGPLQVVNEGDGDTHGNPAPIVDRRTGRVLLAETYNEGRTDGKSCEVPCERVPHLQYSDDEGATWSAPKDLSSSIRPRHWNSWYATGPVHGIQLARGRHAGRLVFGVNAETYAGGRVTDNHAALILSDDGGDTWRIGAVDSWPIADDGTFRQKPSELTLLERSDGSVYVNGREQDGTDLGHRDHTVSRDGGETFVAPFRTIPDLYAPMVQGSVLRLPQRADWDRGVGAQTRTKAKTKARAAAQGEARAGHGHGRTLFAAPADPDRRRTMTIRSSYDEGRTWESVDRGARVTEDWSGYSDMVAISRERIGLLYEGGAADAHEEIRLARFTEDWLGPRRGPDPTTPDHAPLARGASVLGGARWTAGRFGRALTLDGGDGAVRLPVRHSLPLGADDFTVSLWFRRTATRGEQPLLWMGGVGARSPQVAVYGEPASGRVGAHITTLSGAGPATTARVRSVGAYDDGSWHHLALRRGAGRLTLTVDGSDSTTSSDVPGSVSRNSVFGVHVGQKTDSRAHFTGSLDEVRVYRRSLSDSELDSLRTTNTLPMGGSPPVLHLPLDWRSSIPFVPESAGRDRGGSGADGG